MGDSIRILVRRWHRPRYILLRQEGRKARRDPHNPLYNGNPLSLGNRSRGLAIGKSQLIVNEQVVVSTLLVAFDLSGTFVFALSGAAAGVKNRLDLFGVLALAFAAGNSGGIARDVMIGAVPPAAVSNWPYVAVSILAGLITFYWYRVINRLSSPVLMFDAAGLALFAVSGASKALAFGAGPVAATLLGMLTGIGGGMVRDLLVREIPTVLRTELYAVAAFIGAAVVVIGRMLHLPSTGMAIAGAILCFGLRFMAMRRGWHLPTARLPNQPNPETDADLERTTISRRH
jgi:uncharacterized membrane protein YeiH